MNVRPLSPHGHGWLTALLLTSLLATPHELRAEHTADQDSDLSNDLHSIRIVDFLNFYPNVGALIYLAEANDVGIPPGIVTQCTGTLIDERVFLTAGHCVATAATIGLPPFVKAFVSFSPNALDRSTWRAVADFAVHPSLPPCPPPDFCTFQGLDPGILDIGLVFLSRAVRHITPAKIAQPGTLETNRATRSYMTLPGYGVLDSLPGGGAPPISEWDGLRRIKISKLRAVVDNDWASWSLPGVVCFGDSGAPTFFHPRPLAERSHERIVAVASDGGEVCFSRDDRARVDTTAAQDWIRETINQKLGLQSR